MEPCQVEVTDRIGLAGQSNALAIKLKGPRLKYLLSCFQLKIILFSSTGTQFTCVNI